MHVRAPSRPPLRKPDMTTARYFDTGELISLAHQSSRIDTPCSCQKSQLAGWSTQPLSLPDAQLHDIGTLAEMDPEAASYEEYLPEGTQYASDNAPIAPRYFPYNRCAVSECVICKRCFLRYTEGGGYFVDKRIRQLDPDVIVDVALP